MKGANRHVSSIRGKGDKKVVGLSDDNLMFLSDRIDKFMKPTKVGIASKRIGVAEGNLLHQVILVIAMMKLQKCLE